VGNGFQIAAAATLVVVVERYCQSAEFHDGDCQSFLASRDAHTVAALSETPKNTTRNARNTTIKQRNHTACILNN
jgi:hypothetical protein